MVDRLAIFFGDLLMISSVVGLVAFLTIGHPLFLTFTLFETIVHLCAGAALLGAGLMSPRAAQLLFRFFGIATALLCLFVVIVSAQGMSLPGLSIASPITLVIYGAAALIGMVIGFSREVVDEAPFRFMQYNPS